MLPKEELDEEEDLPDAGDPLDEPEEEDLDDLSVEQLLERDRALESNSRQAGEEAEEEPEEPGRAAASPAQQTRREELKRRYPRSTELRQ